MVCKSLRNSPSSGQGIECIGLAQRMAGNVVTGQPRVGTQVNLADWQRRGNSATCLRIRSARSCRISRVRARNSARTLVVLGLAINAQSARQHEINKRRNSPLRTGGDGRIKNQGPLPALPSTISPTADSPSPSATASSAPWRMKLPRGCPFGGCALAF